MLLWSEQNIHCLTLSFSSYANFQICFKLYQHNHHLISFVAVPMKILNVSYNTYIIYSNVSTNVQILLWATVHHDNVCPLDSLFRLWLVESLNGIVDSTDADTPTSQASWRHGTPTIHTAISSAHGLWIITRFTNNRRQAGWKLPLQSSTLMRGRLVIVNSYAPQSAGHSFIHAI